MKYEVIRTDTADEGIRKIILYAAQNFGNTVTLEKLNQIEKQILELEEEPYIGTEPRYRVLKRQGYRVLVLEKDLFFYKTDEENKKVVIYAVVDGRQDYLNIIRGLYKSLILIEQKYIYIFRHIILYNCKMWQKK